VHERGLARTRRAHDRGELALAEFNIYRLQSGDFGVALALYLREVYRSCSGGSNGGGAHSAPLEWLSPKSTSGLRRAYVNGGKQRWFATKCRAEGLEVAPIA
jgi:hypothetical protein